MIPADPFHPACYIASSEMLTNQDYSLQIGVHCPLPWSMISAGSAKMAGWQAPKNGPRVSKVQVS